MGLVAYDTESRRGAGARRAEPVRTERKYPLRARLAILVCLAVAAWGLFGLAGYGLLRLI